jgi:hypothetical protein
MNAKETKAKMDREVELRKLIAKLDRELFGLRNTLTALQKAVHYESTVECTIELTEEDPDGFHGKSYSDYLKSCLADTVHHKDYQKTLVLPE